MSEESNCRILLAEDEHIIAQDLAKQLASLGYRISGIADTGQEAIRLTGTTVPDLILMDIHLRGKMDGIEAAGEVRRRWQIPVIFLTSFTDAETISRARTAGAYGFVMKPYRPTELNAAVRVAIHRHHLSQELFAEHGWLRAILASITDGVIATDVEGHVRYLNAPGEQFTGWSIAEALGKPIEQVFALRSLDRLPIGNCQLRQVLETGAATGRQSCILEARNGTQVFIEDSATPIRDAAGALTGALAVFLDVTERRRAEEERERLVAELQRSNGELARFSHIVAHDLQAPVRTVLSFSELLEKRWRASLDEDDFHLLKSIGAAAADMRELIRALLKYAQVGQQQLQLETLALESLVEEVIALLGPDLAEAKMEIAVRDLPEVSADRIQLKQVFLNLLTNAVKYRQPEQAAHVWISSEDAGDEWRIAVRDNGEGINSEYLHRIFEPLKRLHGPDTPGTGLGLALCKMIVERHGGRIWAESSGRGSGSTFFITLRK